MFSDTMECAYWEIWFLVCSVGCAVELIDTMVGYNANCSATMGTFFPRKWVAAPLAVMLMTAMIAVIGAIAGERRCEVRSHYFCVISRVVHAGVSGWGDSGECWLM